MQVTKILAFGGYQPDKVVTNDDLSKLVDTTDEADNLAAYNQPERALDTRLMDAVANFITADDKR